MATWFWLLHAGAVVRLRNCVVVIKKGGCLTWKRYRAGDSVFCKIVFGSTDDLVQRAFSGIEVMEDIKPICVLHHDNLKIFQSPGTGQSPLPREAFSIVTGAPNSC